MHVVDQLAAHTSLALKHVPTSIALVLGEESYFEDSCATHGEQEAARSFSNLHVCVA